jgi:hypothetical protein
VIRHEGHRQFHSAEHIDPEQPLDNPFEEFFASPELASGRCLSFASFIERVIAESLDASLYRGKGRSLVPRKTGPILPELFKILP